MAEKISVLFCNCAYSDLIDKDKKSQILTVLAEASISLHATDDLCALSAKKDEMLHKISANKELKIIACYPRAVHSLFSAAGAKLDKDVEIFNMRSSTADEIIEALISSDPEKGSQSGTLEKQGDWVPWFPVIDYDRCVDCKQCLNFCLFGVYGNDESGKVMVSNPAGCKTNCPACARVCPQAAIIFAKYDKSPINGNEVLDEHLAEQCMQAKLSDRLKGNVHDVLRQRSAGRKRFSTDETKDERMRQLKEMREQLDIPEDVIAGLSPGGQRQGAGKKEFNSPNTKRCDQPCDENGGKCDK